jgi:hypothetical protein
MSHDVTFFMSYKNMNSYAILVAISAIALTLARVASSFLITDYTRVATYMKQILAVARLGFNHMRGCKKDNITKKVT